MRVFLSGPMGVGKSTVAGLVAARLGLQTVDLDSWIEEKVGAPIGTIFRERGEEAFRLLERQAAQALLGRDGVVVALGGGTVVHARTRHALLERGVLVTLKATPEELVRRVTGGSERPLLARGDTLTVLREILRGRADAYAECHAEVDTHDRSPEEVADAVIRVVESPGVVVPLGSRTYRVVVGAGARATVGELAVAQSPPGLALVVSDTSTREPWAAEVRAALAAAGRTVAEVTIPAGELAKTIASVETIWDAGLGAGIDRHGLVVAVGGGVVGDVAGLAAATLLRGVAFAQVPTTVLSMVDSSVGGKTGINRPHGKNLVGAFHQPRFVVCDVETLTTLPEGERISGLAEVAKAAWLEGEEAVASVEADAAALRAGDPEATTRAIRMAVALKARVVREDEREAGPRMLLNLGHTVGHALEAASGLSLRHGEAVSLGLVASFRVAATLGRAGPEQGERMSALLARLGLPVDLGSTLSPPALELLMVDKKRVGREVHFVVPGSPGCVSVERIPIDTLSSMLCRSSPDT